MLLNVFFHIGSSIYYSSKSWLAVSVEYAEWTFREKYDPVPNKCTEYATKPSDSEAPLFEVWGIWSTSSFLFLPCPVWAGTVVLDKTPSLGQIELFKDLIVQTNEGY